MGPGAAAARRSSSVTGGQQGERSSGQLSRELEPPRRLGLSAVDDHGSPVPGATPTNEQLTIPGYEKTWYDLESKQTTGA